jgi:hypothetical protein
MADEQPRARIVYRVGQITNQDHVESTTVHLAGAEGAVENADVGVDAHQGDVSDCGSLLLHPFVTG